MELRDFYPLAFQEHECKCKNCSVPDCCWMAHTDTGKCHYHSLGLIPEEMEYDKHYICRPSTLEEAMANCIECRFGTHK